MRNQDDELNLRLVRAGGRIWQTPAIRYAYVVRSTFSGLFRQYSQYGYWKVRVIQKHRIPASWRHLVPALFLTSVALLAVLSFVWRGARTVLAVELSAYLLLLLAGTLLAARGARRAGVVVRLPLALAVFHLAYGYGFLRGLVDFVLGPRPATPQRFVALTR